MPDPTHTRESEKSVRLYVLLMRLGILGLFLFAFATAAGAFALFGCACNNANTPSNTPEGMIVNPPDPPRQKTK